MVKAISGEYILIITTAILAFFILIGSLVPIRRVFGNLYSYLDIVGGDKNKSNLEKAILCAYYRCTEGLVADITEKHCREIYPDYNLPLSKNELATSEFAKKLLKEYMGEELRVCEALADVYPVEVEIQEGEKLAKSHVAEAIDCVCQLGSGKATGPEKAYGKVWFGDEFKYDKKVKCATLLDCADSIISKKSQKIYISTVRLTEYFPPTTTYHVLLYPFPIYKGTPYLYSPPIVGGPKEPYSPAIVFGETEEKEFKILLENEINYIHYRVFVETNTTGEKIKTFIGKFVLGGCPQISLSCDNQERTVCEGESKTFCDGNYTIKYNGIQVSWEGIWNSFTIKS